MVDSRTSKGRARVAKVRAEGKRREVKAKATYASEERQTAKKEEDSSGERSERRLVGRTGGP